MKTCLGAIFQPLEVVERRRFDILRTSIEQLARGLRVDLDDARNSAFAKAQTTSDLQLGERIARSMAVDHPLQHHLTAWPRYLADSRS
jgi:hypothetical protein